MKVHRSLDHLPELSAPVITMGSFDGVHAGHRVIIRRLNLLARQAGGCSLLISFHPHPRKVLYPDSAGKDLKLISTLEEKCLLLDEAGLDHLLILEFTPEFALTTSHCFVRDILVARLHAHTIVVGFNHFFGHNKEGSFESLYQASGKFGFRVEEIPEQEIQNETVSSTKIRRALGEGHIQRANACLEHFFLVKANVLPLPTVKGEGERFYRELEVGDDNKLLPPTGMYAISFREKGASRKGLLRIGEGEIRLYPLGGETKVEPIELILFFHKHLEGLGPGTISSALEAVKELVY